MSTSHSYSYSIEDIKDNFSSQDFTRGSPYHQQGRVSNLEINKNILTAKVQGTPYTPYDVEVDIFQEQGEISFSSVCDCPVAFDCKHGVAALLEGINQLAKISPIGIAASTVVTSTQALQTVKLDYTLTSWLNSLSPTQEENNSGKLLIYIIEGSNSRNVAFKISPVVVSVLKKGNFGTSKRLNRLDQLSSYNRAKYIQDDDVVILRLISSFSSYSGYHSFDIPVAKEATILLQLIMATERCYLPNPYLPEKMLVMGKPRRASISWKTEHNGAQNIKVAVSGVESSIILATYPLHYICPISRTVGVLEIDLSDKQAVALLRAPTIPPEQAPL